MIENFLKQVFKGWVDKINSVHSIFANYYGEERVDLQMPYTESEFVNNVMNWDLLNAIHIEGDKLIEINVHFAKVLQAVHDNISPSFHLYLQDLESLAAIGITEEICISMLQSLLDSEFNSYINCDFSNIKLLVLFPEVTVTNENNKSTVIYDVFIKVPINVEGTMRGQFRLCRSTFTANQYNSGYMFSHCPSISNSSIPDFKECCLGSGPIRETISNLMGAYDEDIWLLFCLELDAYVRVESLDGGPYIKLETIGSNSRTRSMEKEFPQNIKTVIPAKRINRNIPTSPNTIIYNLINEFIYYLIKNQVVNFSFLNGAYTIAHSYIDIRVIISNAFIAYINTLNPETLININSLYSKEILVRGVVKNGGIEVSSISSPTNNNQGENFMPFNFKGERVPFIVKDAVVLNTNESIFLSNCVTHNILNNLLSYLNYGRTPNNTPVTGSYY